MNRSRRPRRPRLPGTRLATAVAAGLLALLLAGRDPVAALPVAAPDTAGLRRLTAAAADTTLVEAPPGAMRVRADRLVDRLVDGQPVTFLFGNVLIDRDTLAVRSDTAVYYRSRDVYDFNGQVSLQSRQRVLTARSAQVRRSENAADAVGDVRVEEGEVVGTAARAESRRGGALLRLIGGARLVSPEYTVWGDTVLSSRGAAAGGEAAHEMGEAFGAVRLLDQGARTLITGDHAVFDRGAGTACVDRRPLLTTRESGAQTLTGSSRLMRFQRAPDRIVMIDSVRIRQDATTAVADTAHVLGRERVLLRGNPVVRDGKRSTMTGRAIEFLYREGRLDRVLLLGQARIVDAQPESLAALHPGLPSSSTLEGDTIDVAFREDEIRSCLVVGSAHSVYVPEDTADEVAFNDVRGDTIILDFRRGRVDVVRVRGEMSGTYHFVRRENVPPPVTAASDSLGADAVAAAPADSAVAARAGPPGGFDFGALAETVDYAGERAVFRLDERTIEVQGEARLDYGTLTLTARDVRFDTEARELYADGEPLLVDDAQKIAGKRMGYNFGSRAGAVQDGVTAHDKNYYTGREIRRFQDGTIKIRSGRMTSCDLARPHYHFWADKMRIELDKRVVAAPVVVKVGEVPLFALPFYFKSLEGGRRSGILFPNFGFGWSRRDGRYIRDWGYYWATNDYLDFILRGDYSERHDLAMRLTNRYVKRYSFQGSIDWSRRTTFDNSRTEEVEPQTREWQLHWNHNQEALFDAYVFRSDVSLASRTLARNDLTTDTGRDVVSGRLHSTVFLSRNWRDLSTTLNILRDEEVNAGDDDPLSDQTLSTTSLPQLSVSFRSRNVLAPLPPGRKGSLPGDLLRAINYGHSYELGRRSVVRELTDVVTTSARGQCRADVRPPRLGFLNLTAGVQGSQAWQRETRNGSEFAAWDTLAADTNGVVVSPIFTEISERTERTTPSLSLSGSASTKLYGVMPLKLGALRALRHTFDVAVNYSWRPQIGDKQAGSSSIGLSMGNRFDLKLAAGEQKPREDPRRGATAQPDSTREQHRKLDGLLDWRLSTSYNPDGPTGGRWGMIGSSIIIKPGRSRNLDLKINNAIEPYDLRIQTTNVTYGLSLSGRVDTGREETAPGPDRNAAIDRLGATSDTTAVTPEGVVPEEAQAADVYGAEFVGAGGRAGAGEGEDPSEGGRFIPWSVNSSLSYQRNHLTGTTSARTSVSFSAQITTNWDFAWSGELDLEAGTLTRQNWSLNRDLHCWALEFTRELNAVNSQFGFRIYLKSIPAVEVTRGNRYLTRRGGGLAGALGSGLY